MERFWAKVDKSGECWTWRAYRNARGYGYFALDGKMGLAHRAAWSISRGPIPQGMQVCHHCDNPSCVRPDHLFVGTASDNMQDCLRKNRHRPPQGSRNGSATLSEEQVGVVLMLHDGGAAPRALAESFGVSIGVIRNIVRGRTWRHVA